MSPFNGYAWHLESYRANGSICHDATLDSWEMISVIPNQTCPLSLTTRLKILHLLVLVLCHLSPCCEPLDRFSV